MQTFTRTRAALVPVLALAAALVVPAGPAGARSPAPDWRPCGAPLECAELAVPLDHARPGGRRITLALSRLPATDRAHRIGTLVLNGGGPGETGLDLPARAGTAMREVAARYDLVGVDPRFVGRSNPIDCGWPIGLWVRSAGSTRARFDQQVAVQRDLAERCARRHGDLLPYATTRDTARDLDLVRRALGEHRISFLGYSYGSYLGAVYAQMFPGRTDRLVLDSAGDPRRWGPRATRGTEEEAERALRGWASWAAARHGTYGLGTTAARVLATVDAVVAAAERQPLRIGGHEVDETVVPYLVALGSGDDRPAARASFATTVRTLHRAALGGAAPPGPELDGLLTVVLTGAGSALAGPAAAITCGDRAAPRDPETYWADVQRSRERHPLFGPLKNSIWPCAFWPGRPREQPTRIGNPAPALIVAATGDTATTYRGSRALHRMLTGSRLLTLRGVTAHGIYGEYGDPCVDAVVNAYLAAGVLPGADPVCRPRAGLPPA